VRERGEKVLYEVDKGTEERVRIIKIGHKLISDVSGTRGSKHEDFNFLGFNAV
jgi:hypothetical protein